MIRSWDKLTIAKWQRILDIESIGFDWYEKEIEILSVLCDKSKDELLKLSIGEIAEMKKAMEFLSIAPSEKLPTSVMVGDIQHIVHYKVTDKTAGQFVDAMTFTKDREKVNENLHNVLSIFVIPKGENYDGSKQQERAEYLREHLTMDVAHPMAVFFYRVYTVSLKDIEASLIRKNNKMMASLLNQLERKKAMKKFMRGLSQLIPLRKAMQPSGMKSQSGV
jgi:hypothetical protein